MERYELFSIVEGCPRMEGIGRGKGISRSAGRYVKMSRVEDGGHVVGSRMLVGG